MTTLTFGSIGFFELVKGGFHMRKKDSLELAHYVDSIEAQQKLYKRSLLVVVMSQIFGGAGLAAGITVGALIARDMLGTASFAGCRLLCLHLDLRLQRS